MRSLPLLFAVAGVAAAFGTGLQAQEPDQGPDGHVTTRVPGVEVLTIPGKPFTAHTTTIWTRTLADGSTVRLRLNANIARDSSGRVYRERRSFVPDGSTATAPLNQVLIYDPTSSTLTTCTVRSRSCLVTGFRPRTTFAVTPAGSFDHGTRFLTREPLGVNTIEGLNVTGTRETVTVNAGAVGNDHALTSTRELWYSPDLETNLAVTRQDATEGTQAIQLSDLSRSEPEGSEFAVPAGFAIQASTPQPSPR